MKELELYFHIPFCERKCAYCDFLSAPADPPVRISYIKKLQEEIAYYGPQFKEYQVSSIFFWRRYTNDSGRVSACCHIRDGKEVFSFSGRC